MLKNIFILIVAISFFISCGQKKKTVDFIIHNARIYSVDSAFSVFEAMAIANGKIVELNTNETILANYEAPHMEDVAGKIIFPGFIDAHCHFLAYGLGLAQVNLTGTRSYKEVLARTVLFSRKKDKSLDASAATIAGTEQNGWLIGRGWDQNDWENKQFPTNESLDSLFPNTPVLLMRIDGHAALANSLALKKAGIHAETKIKGGEILVSGHKLTGVLIDNAVNLVKDHIPTNGKTELSTALLNAQENCIAQGLTTVDDAGLMKSEVELIDVLQKAGKLKMRMYAMLSDNPLNYEQYLTSGPYKTDRLTVRAFKFYADGALGSRGACLHKEYNDKKNWKGFLLSDAEHFKTQAVLLAEKGFQMNTHCIGDSALSVLLNIYAAYCNKSMDRRWRIEHAQIFTKTNISLFNPDIIPSVQPTHATSDMYWVKDRLGEERSKLAYAYKALLGAAGRIALGTDFPVEDISPFKTFYAATARKDASGFPEKGFQSENALSREETLRGMTIWAAYANFEEKEKGSLEKGKLADFVVLDTDLMTCLLPDVLKTKVLATYIDGEKVYSVNR